MSSIRSSNDNANAWDVLANLVRNLLTATGYGSEVVDWVIGDMKARSLPLVFLYDISTEDICADCKPKVAARGAQMKDAISPVMRKWVEIIIQIECDLWVARFDPPHPGDPPQRPMR